MDAALSNRRKTEGIDPGPYRKKHWDKWDTSESGHIRTAQHSGKASECRPDPLALRNVTLYTCAVIKTFRHKGLQAFFEMGSKAGIQPHHAARLKRQLTRLDLAASADAMNLPG